MKCPIISLVGDFNERVPAHRAIPRALELSVAATQQELTWRWVHTSQIREAAHDLADSDAVWVVPASPYANMKGVLETIRWARETGRPFLGTCGGSQHALIEFARNAAGLAKADHAETNPEGELLLVAFPLSRTRASNTPASQHAGRHCPPATGPKSN